MYNRCMYDSGFWINFWYAGMLSVWRIPKIMAGMEGRRMIDAFYRHEMLAANRDVIADQLRDEGKYEN